MPAMIEKKDEFIREMKNKLDDLNYKWSVERDKYEAKAQHLSAEARKQYEEAREELRGFRGSMKEKIIDLEVAGENAWDDVKVGVEKAWKELSRSFEKATAHFKK
jgi:histidinol dehydrogenase